jgi:spore coat polysaccharide biosynthesis protein SpsF (cytidylyltransferase family)
MDPVVVVQARMSSTRLPGKVLLPLGRRPVLGHVVDRCRSVSRRVVVATSTDRDDDAIERWCASEGVSCVRGSRDDVLARFIDVLDAHPADAAVRVTADCPLVDTDVLRAVRDEASSDRADYASVAAPWPLGLPSEGFRVPALRDAARRTVGGAAVDAPAREHVTLSLYRHPDRYRVRTVAMPHGFAEPLPRLTLDEPDDFVLLQEVFSRFPAAHEPTTAELAAELAALFAREPNLRRLNERVRQNPVPS